MLTSRRLRIRYRSSCRLGSNGWAIHKKGGTKDEWLDRASSNLKVRMFDGDDIEPAPMVFGEGAD